MDAHLLRRMAATLFAVFVLLGTLPASAADVESYALVPGSPDILYQVVPGESVGLDPDDFRSFFYARSQSDTFRSVTFQPDSSLQASNGVLYCDYGGENETAFSRASLNGARFYDYSSLYGTYPLDGLLFVSNRQADGNTAAMTFTVHGDSEQYAGLLHIAISGEAPAAPVVDLTWHVTAGGTVRFVRNDFRDFFNDRASKDDSFRYVTFQPDPSFNPDNGYIYYDFEGNDQREFTASMLRDADFFYSSTRYGSYPISGMTFLAANEAGGNLVKIPFTVFGRTERYSGTLVIQIDWARSGGAASPVYGPSAPPSTASAAAPDTPSVAPPVDTAPESEPANDSGETTSAPVETPPPSGPEPVNDSGETTAAPVETPPPAEPEPVNDSGETTAQPVETPPPAGPEPVDDSGETAPPDNPQPEPEADIAYIVRAGESVEFDLLDFTVPAESKLNGALRYVTFATRDALSPDAGQISANSGGLEEVSFTESTLDDYRFYAESDNYGDYALESLYFSAPVTAPARILRIYCTLHSSRGDSAILTMSIELLAADEGQRAPGDAEEPEANPPTGTNPPASEEEPEANPPTPPETNPDETTPPDQPAPEVPKREPVNILTPFDGTPVPAGNLLYCTTWETPLRLVSDDFDRFFRRAFPGGTISHANFTDLPSEGKLFYDYYASSPYGDAPKLELSPANISYMNFYFSPAELDRSSLAELTYVPGEPKNICESIPFSVTGLSADEQTVQCTGNLLISVTKALIADVYGAIPIGRTVSFPAPNIVKNIGDGIGGDVNGLRLLELPESSVGAVTVSDGKTPADPQQIYHNSSMAPFIKDLQFVPADKYSGSVEIPYLVIDAEGAAIGIGHFNLGIISTLKRFSDVTSSVWCYKYVTELAAAGVVGGYQDNTYRPDISVTWGAALKLIMLAAGYEEQKGTTMSPFQGYLDKALADRLLPRQIDLWEPITRLEVAELAAAAMKLDTSYLSSAKPFSDTDSPSVQALNAAGIINGYYSEGESTFRPSGTLNRGQAAAIVWRMRNYKG